MPVLGAADIRLLDIQHGVGQICDGAGTGHRIIGKLCAFLFLARMTDQDDRRLIADRKRLDLGGKPGLRLVFLIWRAED